MLERTNEKVKMPLILSHWDASVPVIVPYNIVEDLKNYHLMGIRFLYDCFRKGLRGAILNHENDMNFQIQVSAFFNALHSFVTPKSPALIVSSERFINSWHYHLKLHGGYNVTVLTSGSCKEILLKNTHRMILTTIDNTTMLKELKGIDFFSVVVDELDLVATKTILKQLKGQFNIGLTTRNFLKQPDQKLFWTMLNWSNPGVAGKFADFAIEDHNHLINFRNPYRTWWQRLTWIFCDSFKIPTDEEQKQYKIQLQQWSIQHNITHLQVESKRTTRKSRKAVVVPIKTKHNIKSEEYDMEHTTDEESHIVKEEDNSTNIENFNLSNNLLHDTKNILDPQNSFSDESPSKNDLYKSNSQNSNSSQSTIIYEHQHSPSNNDENPILSSIISSNSELMTYDELKNDFQMDVDEDDDVLTSIIKN